MDNFTHKNTRGARPRTSIDGISPRGSARREGSISFSRPSGGSTDGFKPNQRRLDDFKRREGLEPAQVGSIIHTPERPKYNSKKRFSLFKKKQSGPQLDGIKRPDKRSIRKKRMKIAAAGMTAVLVLGFFGYGYLKGIFGGGGGAAAWNENVDPSKLRGEGDGRVNILLMGRGGPGAEAPDLTDTIMIVSIDPINKEAGLVSIPRDLYVTIPEHGSMKINEAFYTGKASVLNNSGNINDDVKHRADQKGYDTVKSTVESVLGIPIHYRAMVDFSGFKKAIDTVGGVDVNVPKAVRDQMQFDGKQYLLNVRPGWKHFDGFEALAYARSRYTSSGGDFERSERQRLILVALKDKIFSTGTLTNPAKIAQLVDNFGDHVQTDFSLSDLNRLQEISREIDSGKVASIGLVDPPHDFLTTSNIGGLSVVLPKAGAGNYKEIQNYIRNTLKDGYLKSENASVMILNGTDRPGLASEKADELRSYGYNIGTVDNAPSKNYPNTIIIDLRNGEKKYTKRYLEQRFGVAARTGLPDQSIQPGGADFVIILGNDTRTGP